MNADMLIEPNLSDDSVSRSYIEVNSFTVKKIDARRRLEDKMEEVRLQKEIDQFDFDY